MDAVEQFLLPDSSLDPVDAAFDVNVDGAEVFDLNGDGVLETRVVHTDAGVTVASDVDGDGVMDKFTAFGRDGEYQSWEIFRESEGSGHWNRTGFGEIGT